MHLIQWIIVIIATESINAQRSRTANNDDNALAVITTTERIDARFKTSRLNIDPVATAQQTNRFSPRNDIVTEETTTYDYEEYTEEMEPRLKTSETATISAIALTDETTTYDNEFTEEIESDIKTTSTTTTLHAIPLTEEITEYDYDYDYTEEMEPRMKTSKEATVHAIPLTDETTTYEYTEEMESEIKTSTRETPTTIAITLTGEITPEATPFEATALIEQSAHPLPSW